MNETEHLKRWIRDLQSGQYINCVYCGHNYGPNDQGAAADVLRRHVTSCPEHPLAQLVATCQGIVDYIDGGGQSISTVSNQLYRAIEKTTK